MSRPKAVELATLFELLGREARDLRAVCRWLVLGPELSAAILPEQTRPPTAEDLVSLLRLLEREAAELLPIGFWLVDASEHTTAAWAEFQLDRLIATDIEAWEHPAQVLERPWPDYQLLWNACIARRKRARGKRRQHLLLVEEKLERTARIEASARQRRERRQKRRRRR